MLSVGISLFLAAGPLTGTAAAAPVPSSTPSISPTSAYVGETLTVTQGMYTGITTSPSDDWQRCSGATCTSTGIIGSTYTVTYSDVGYTLKVVETATDGITPIQQDSNQTSVVPAPPTNTAAPVIAASPPPGVGNTLTATQGAWTNADPGSITDTWERCNGSTCTPISGTTTTTPTTSYKLTPADIGHTIKVMETATNGGTPANPPSFSQPTGTVTYVPSNTSPPTISGNAQQGQTLMASPGIWTTNPTSYTYQWQDCDSSGHGCAAIAGATAATYTLTAVDVGNTIQVRVSGVNGGGSGLAAASAPTGLVHTTSTTSLTTSPGAWVTNEATTLAATVTSQAATAAPSGVVAFLDQGKAISGCGAVPVSPSGQSVTVFCQASFAAGSAQVTATFTPGAGSAVLGSSSPSQTLTIGKDATKTALDASSPLAVDTSTTYTATVAPSTVPGGAIQPSGSVQFLDGGKPIAGCTARPVVSGGATCAIAYSATGRRSIVAQYLGDANFAGSSSSAKTVNVTALAARGTITATMQWTFAYAPSYTRVLTMVINGVPVGATVEIQCRGRGCPFVKRSSVIARPHCKFKRKGKHKRSCPPSGRANLTGRFHGRPLRPGARITIEIRRPRFVGKYYSFTMRARKQPRVRIGCLAVNGTRPDVGC